MKGLILFLGLIVIAGCATITRGVEEVFVVESDPTGAKVTLLYDEPVILYVEDKADSPGGVDGGYDKDQTQENVMLAKLEGVTPATFKIPRRGAFTVTIEKEGYQPVSTRVETQMAQAGGAALAGNICLGGCLGAAIDAGSGATLEHVPSKVTVKLLKQDAEDQPPRVMPYSKGGVPLKPGDDGYKSK